MKILIPVLGFGRSGGNRVLSNLADELIKLGHIVKFLSPDTSEKPYFPTTAEILWADKNGNIKTTNIKTKKASVFSIQKSLTRAFIKLDPESYDVIIANHSFTTIPIKTAGLIRKTLYYVQAYEPDYYRLTPGIKNMIFEFISAFSYKMNLFTIVNAEIYLKYKKIKATRVLYPGVDFNNFYPSNKTGKNENEVIIGTIGRLEKFKGTHYVLEAFNKLKKKYSRIKLYVAFGNADDFGNYEDVYCFQPGNDKELGDYYRTLDYYFCAGYTQLGAFHYPVAEAMCCGIPVITTNYYPASCNNAWLAEPKNVENMIDQFEIAYKNKELKEKKIQQALEDVQQFKWELVAQKLDVYLKEFREKS